MSRPGRALWLIAAVQLAALVVTYPVPGLGAELWHHVASLGVVVAASLALYRPMTRRSFLAIGVLSTSILAAVSGFYLLYWKEGIRVAGYQDWGVFWHVAWSWAAMVFFFQHGWVNRVQFVHFVRRSFQGIGPGVVHAGLYLLVAIALWWTWGPVKSWFTNENYVPLSLVAWLAATVPAYIAWIMLRRSVTLWQVRRPVDLGLVPIATLAVVSGFPLLFLGDLMDAMGWKYVSKYWHVWPSVVFSVLVFVHAVQAWGTVQAHWRRMDRGPRTQPTEPGADARVTH